ncbi:protein BIG GRAIN 1-like B [Humulus lupulus]|uniref:protein BIG GRAIN 1-like B n=1 Tax=Humulus lupulus TaxID=3486 RepID=UPI002B4175A1|nr:protein BIG GRAIN 1-like B [Humulus lupulus]
MDKWEKETNPRRRRTPSFSSSLLDVIYRSIDKPKDRSGYATTTTRVVMKKKQKEEKEKNNLRRAMMIENWVEKQSVQNYALSTSTSNSSADSSFGALWSSSETESTQNHRTKTKPFRATIGVAVSSDQSKKKVTSTQFDQRSSDKSQQKKTTKPENGGFSKTKLKALKIYGELKKVKQPISPGGRIATFINSIFNSGNVKKAKIK